MDGSVVVGRTDQPRREGGDDAGPFRWTRRLAWSLWVLDAMQWMYQATVRSLLEQDPALEEARSSVAFRWTAAEGWYGSSAIPRLDPIE